MRAPAVSFAKRFTAALMASLLTFTLLPANALAEEEGDSLLGREPQETNSIQADEAAEASPETDDSNPAASSAEAGTLAASLMGRPTAFVNADVALDGEPVVGSFTVDGLTFAVIDDSTVELVGVSQVVVAGSTPAASETEAETSVLVLPESTTYDDVEYSVTSIGAYAFYLSGVTSVELPASIVDVDDRAFRSSDVASVTVAEDNPAYSSFDGALYDANTLSLLLIPEGKQGTVLLPKTAESTAPSVFSHCPLVTQIAVEEGSAAFASENGLLYDASMTTLLRVPAGATDITIREGCTTIAAGALEACASLTAINAPASVTFISPDVLTSVPTVSLPAATVADDGVEKAEEAFGSEVPTSPQPPSASSTEASDSTSTQLTALIALTSIDDGLPEVEASAITAKLQEGAKASSWEDAGFIVAADSTSDAFLEAEVQAASSARAYSLFTWCNGLYAQADYGGTTTWYPNDRFHWPDADANTFAFKPNATLQWNPNGGNWTITFVNPGCTFVCYSTQRTYPGGTTWTSQTFVNTLRSSVYAIWRVPVTWEANGGYWSDDPSDTQAKTDTYYSNDPTSGWQGSIVPTRPGYAFKGWQSVPPDSRVSQLSFAPGENVTVSYAVTYVAQWEQLVIDFDTSSEPGDDDYPGEEKPSITVSDAVDDEGKVEIEDPKRPGYVFQGWVIPDADGEHAIDQDLVYKDETDGKWYVDASKLPDYAGDDGRVELTARWTSVISVDVPSAATFYYDLVTDQSSEAHEAALSGTTSFSSRSQVDLRVCGLESVKASGADALFSSGADSALLSVYPAKDGSATTVEDAQGPAGEKPSTAVDFALDDIVLEAAFSKAGPDAFSIPAGDDLTLSYRLNLGDGASLDYDKVLSMAEGDEASLASISYCFAADADVCCFWTIDDSGKTLSMFDIKADAEAIAAGDAATTAKYTAWMNADHRFYVKWYDQGVYELEGGLSENKCSIYEVRIIGLNHDDKSDGSGKAGITFQFVECLTDIRPFGDASTRSWGQSTLRAALNDDTGAIWEQAPTLFRSNIKAVNKHSYDAGSRGTTQDRLFLVSISELITVGTVWPNGKDTAANGWGELAKMRDVSPQYAFWKNKGISGMSVTARNQLLAKHVNGTVSAWATRSVSVGGEGSTAFVYLASVGTGLIPNGSSKTTEIRGVSPAFCF